MGLLVDGKWQDKWYDTDANDGRFQREESGFRNWITADGSAGPSGIGALKPSPIVIICMCLWPALGRTVP